MLKLTIEPENPKKISLEEYKAIIAARNALLVFEKNKNALKDFSDVQSSINQLRLKLKAYRQELKKSLMKYTITYKSTNRSWSKLLPEVKHSFVEDLNNQPDKSKYLYMKNIQKELRDKIKNKKDQLRSPESRKIFTRSAQSHRLGIPVTYRTCAGIIYKPNKIIQKRNERVKGIKNECMGVFMSHLRSKDKEKVFQEKKPLTDNSHVGVEIEFGCDLNEQDLAFMLMEVGVYDKVHLKRDGSVHAGTHSHELCVLGTEKEIFNTIDKVCSVLEKTNAVVNKTCGLHVHLDMRNRNPEVAFNNLVCAQNILYAMNPYCRQTGTYSKRVDTKDFTLGKKGGHYAGINSSAHDKHKTIEVRIHAGTVQAIKINNWIKLLLLIVNKKDATKKASSSLREFISKYGIDSDLANYMVGRLNKFAGEENKNVEETGAA